jgi:carbamoyltransferase
MNILGISGGIMRGNQDGAAVLLIDGDLAFAQEEERFTREKYSVGALPEYAIRAALSHTGLSMNDIDVIAFHANYVNIEENLARYFRHHFGSCPQIQFVDHHFSHAVSAYYASGFKDAMILTADLSGDGISTTLSFGRNGKIETLQRYAKPQSLGVFYSLVTQILGFRRDSDEYKVMGMASYGKPTEDLSWLLKIGDGGYELNEAHIVALSNDAPNPSKQEPLYSDALIEKVGWRRLPGTEFKKEHFNFASSAQHTLNSAAQEMIRSFAKRHESRNLCVAGGVGLNCVMNQQLLAMPEVDRLFVQPASSDAGTSLGAAYAVAAEKGEKIMPFAGAHLGNEFTPEMIQNELDTIGVPYRETDDPAGEAAKAIYEGKIVGWYQGRHEFGPRALGARSILANPDHREMKDIINVRVKFREEFRPFAPSVLLEDADRYFDTLGQEHPYMTVTTDARADRPHSLPSVVHVDGTARIQTVDQERCPLYHELIANFQGLTGVPALLNTSFNVKGQPIVNSPTQAIGTLYGSGMDVAVLGPFVVEKLK